MSRCFLRWAEILVLKNYWVETWIKAQLCANCARKNLLITGALPASTTTSMPKMLQLAQTMLLVRAGSVTNNVVPELVHIFGKRELNVLYSA